MEGHTSRTDPLQILIVDDTGNSEDLTTLLEAAGHSVHKAVDQREALILADQYRIDFAMVEIGSPGIIGYECARQLRIARGLDVTLVAMADRSVNEDRRTYYGGFDHLLLRPIEVHALDAILGSSRAKE